MNKRNIENVRKRIQLGKYNKGCYYWAGNETTYSAVAPKDRDVLTGEWGSKYDYKPSYMKYYDKTIYLMAKSQYISPIQIWSGLGSSERNHPLLHREGQR